MNRDELLTKLAMEAEEWPVNTDRMFYEGDRIMRVVDPRVITTDCAFYENEWAARRAELINKPSWDDAPEWAEWLAQGKRGEWCFYPAKPEQSDDMWINDEPKTGIWVDVHCRGRIPAGHDWRETLESRPDFDESRADAIGQNGPTGDHYRELNPTTSSLTQSQAVEAARDTGICSDGSPCGSPHDVRDDAYCAGCPNETMTPEEEELPAQEKHDCPRCGGCFYSPPHDECPCLSGRQERYRGQDGDDWIDEFARTSTVEEFRGAMRFTIGKYNRRMGKKDDIAQEVRKMRDYCDRWLAYEVDQ